MNLVGRRRVLKSCGWEGNHNSDQEVNFCAFLPCGLVLCRLWSKLDWIEWSLRKMSGRIYVWLFYLWILISRIF
jgi:hypothetical protein